MKKVPPVECSRCDKDENLRPDEVIQTPDDGTVCKECATEGEVEAWQEYKMEMEARQAEAEEQRRRDEGLGF